MEQKCIVQRVTLFWYCALITGCLTSCGSVTLIWGLLPWEPQSGILVIISQATFKNLTWRSAFIRYLTAEMITRIPDCGSHVMVIFIDAWPPTCILQYMASVTWLMVHFITGVGIYCHGNRPNYAGLNRYVNWRRAIGDFLLLVLLILEHSVTSFDLLSQPNKLSYTHCCLIDIFHEYSDSFSIRVISISDVYSFNT